MNHPTHGCDCETQDQHEAILVAERRAAYQPGRARVVYRLADGSMLCDACIADTDNPAAALADVVGRDDAGHCLGCDYHAAGTPETCPVCANLREVGFRFDMGPTFHGWTDDTRWNGFLNVRVAHEALVAIRAWLESVEPGYEAQADGADYWPPVDVMGLVNLSGGFATVEVDR
jgi:hypothetical protein